MQRSTRLAALLATMLLPFAAQAENFTLFVFETAPELAKRDDSGPAGRAYWDAFAAFGAQMRESGVLRGGSPLVPAQGIAVDSHALGGYFMIDVEDRAAAERWAAEAPATRTGGRVIVVPALASPAMAAHP